MTEIATPRTGAQCAVDALAAEGVRHVFGLPGTTLMEIIDELGTRDDIRYIPVRHEEVAAFMADGYARASGEVGVCMASRGPGAAHLSIGVHNGHAEAVPILALIGQIPDAFAQRESFEEMDMLAFFAPMTKWGTEVHQVGRVPELVQRACRTACSGRPGAVVVSLPHDIQKQTVADPQAKQSWKAGHPQASDDDVDAAAGLLADAARPVIIIGGGCQGHDPAVVHLAHTLAAPVVTTWLRKGRYPNSDDSYVGCLGYGAVETTTEAVRSADVVIALGTKLSEFSTDQWTLLSPATKLIHVDLDEDALGRNYIPTVGMLADAGRTAALLDERVAECRTPDKLTRLAGLRQTYLRQTRLPHQQAQPESVTSEAVMSAVQQLLDTDPSVVLVADAPGFGTWMHRYLVVDRPNAFYGAAGGSMGWGMPAAMGIALARPEARVVCIAGDASFWMVAQDLETAVREGIRVVIVITNNFAFGNTRDRQRFAFDERYNGVFYGNPDFAAFARLLGAHGERVTKDADVAAAIDRALASDLPAVIDLVQDRFEGLPADLVPPGVASRR